MALPILLLIPVAFAFSLTLTLLLVRTGRRLGTLDTAGSTGHEKAEIRDVPNIGGIAIVAAVVVPLLAALGVLHAFDAERLLELVPALRSGDEDPAWNINRARESTPLALAMLGGALALHVMGLVDDRRGLGPLVKLGVQFVVAIVLVVFFDVRLLTVLPPLLSIALTVLWIVAITNAINFMDNMDGLAGGVTVIAGSLFLVATLVNGQWFIAATLALLVGGVLGFLTRNLPPAKIFMGDGGSLVIGYLLAVLTARTTFLHPELGGGWYGVFMPLIVLAVPLYDFVTVTVIRLREGKSPFVGDQRHFSHRLVQRGLSPRGAVVVIWSATAVTGIGGIALGRLLPWQAALVVVQTLLVLGSLAIFEHASRRSVRGDEA